MSRRCGRTRTPVTGLMTSATALALVVAGLPTSLAQRADDVREQVERLIGQLRDTDAQVRGAAADALGKLPSGGGDPEPLLLAIPALVEAMGDEDTDVRASAVRALGNVAWRTQCASGAEPAIPVLTELLRQDRSAKVRGHAARTLGCIGRYLEDQDRLKPAIEPLLRALEDEEEFDLSPAADGTIPQERVCIRAAFALTMIAPRLHDGAALASAIPVLVDGLDLAREAGRRWFADWVFQQAIAAAQGDEGLRAAMAPSIEALAEADPKRTVLEEFLTHVRGGPVAEEGREGDRVTLDPPGNFEIWVMSADGSAPANVTNSPARDWHPVWSPDGARIAFDSDRDGDHEIYAMGADGSHITQLTDNDADDRSPSWSMDGSKIVFQSDRTGSQRLHVMAADGSGETALRGSEAGDGHPMWSPTDNRIVFASAYGDNRRITVLAADGGSRQDLTHGTAPDSEPTWSPEGARIAFSSERGEARHVYTMRADGAGQARLTDGPAEEYGAAWHPEGHTIGCSAVDGNRWQAFAVDLEDPDPRALVTAPGHVLMPTWSPDGEKVAFVRVEVVPEVELPRIAEALLSDDPQARLSASTDLSHLVPEPPSDVLVRLLIEPLAAALTRGPTPRQCLAARALGNTASHVDDVAAQETAIALLSRAAKRKGILVRTSAARQLSLVAPNAVAPELLEPAIDPLLDGLRHRHAEVRLQAARALSSMGPVVAAGGSLKPYRRLFSARLARELSDEGCLGVAYRLMQVMASLGERPIPLVAEGSHQYFDENWFYPALGDNPSSKARRLHASGDWVPLADLLDPRTFEEHREEAGGIEGAMLIGWVLENLGPRALGELWAITEQGNDRAANLRAIEEALGVQLSEVERQILETIQDDFPAPAGFRTMPEAAPVAAGIALEDVKSKVRTLEVDVGRFHVRAHYVRSDLAEGDTAGLPVVVFVGRYGADPAEGFQRVCGRLAEPAVLVWVEEPSPGDEPAQASGMGDPIWEYWSGIRAVFPPLIRQCRASLGTDPNRVYLTGWSWDGANAWKLAYDRPELYAGVVAISPDPQTLARLHVYPPAQGALRAAAEVPTVVVYETPIRSLTLWSYAYKEAERHVVAGHPDSRWWWDTNVSHVQLREQWFTALNYLLQLTRESEGR